MVGSSVLLRGVNGWCGCQRRIRGGFGCGGLTQQRAGSERRADRLNAWTTPPGRGVSRGRFCFKAPVFVVARQRRAIYRAKGGGRFRWAGRIACMAALAGVKRIPERRRHCPGSSRRGGVGLFGVVTCRGYSVRAASVTHASRAATVSPRPPRAPEVLSGPTGRAPPAGADSHITSDRDTKAAEAAPRWDRSLVISQGLSATRGRGATSRLFIGSRLAGPADLQTGGVWLMLGL